MDKVPVEYVECVINWLKEQGYKKIGIDGMSKGSEMALIVASMFFDISCVIVRVPSYFVSEGLKGSGKKKGPSGTVSYLLKKIKAPILMLSSKRDSVWPSYENCIYMENRLKETDFLYEYKHVAYENMSHALLTKLPLIYKIAFKSERKNSKDCDVV